MKVVRWFSWGLLPSLCVMMFVSLAGSVTGCRRLACLDQIGCDGYKCDLDHQLCLTECQNNSDCNLVQGFVCRKHPTENRNQCICNPDNALEYCHFVCYKDEDCQKVPACLVKLTDIKTKQVIQFNRCTFCSDPCADCVESLTDPNTGEPTGQKQRKLGCVCLDPAFDKKLSLQNEWVLLKTAWQTKFNIWKQESIAWKKGEGATTAPEFPPLPKAPDSIEGLFEIQNWKQQVAKWQETKLKAWKEEPRDVWLAKNELEQNQALDELPYVPDLSSPSTPFSAPKQCKLSTD